MNLRDQLLGDIRPPQRAVKVRRVEKPKRKQKNSYWVVYEVSLEDGSSVIYWNLSVSVAKSIGVELLPKVFYCGPCKRDTPHLYLQHTDEVHCEICGNALFENDNRPYASILRWKEKK